MNENQINIFKVGPKEDELKLTIKQVRVLCEAMWDFKTHIKEMPTGGPILQMNKNFKLNEIDELFNILQEAAGYDFIKQLEKCKNRKAKNEDIGEDALILLSNKNKDNKEKS